MNEHVSSCKLQSSSSRTLSDQLSSFLRHARCLKALTNSSPLMCAPGEEKQLEAALQQLFSCGAGARLHAVERLTFEVRYLLYLATLADLKPFKLVEPPLRFVFSEACIAVNHALMLPCF